jgi:hypothetical protein
MGAPRDSKTVQAGIEVMAGKGAAKNARRIRKDLGPLIAAVKGAKGAADLQRRLGPGLLKRMGTGGITETVSATGVAAVGIGAVAAEPRRRKDEGGRRKDEG